MAEKQTPLLGSGARETDRLGRLIDRETSPTSKQSQGLLIAKIEKSRRQFIVVSVREFNGCPKVDVRTHELDRFGDVQSTDRAIVLRREVLPELIEALRRALQVLG